MLDINSTSVIIESWLIPFDIIMIICTTITVVLAFIFLSTIILDKTCHTVPMMLVANSCLAEFVFGSDMLAMAIFSFQSDLQQSQYEDSLCIFRGFLGYVVAILQFYSYLLQAIYRYLTVVYPTRLFYQSARFQFLLLFLSFFTSPPKYHFRIAYIFVDGSVAFVMIALFSFTEPLKSSILKRIGDRRNMVMATMT